ncbi:hypothetical protein NLG97_g803 [Lecanicillium saksenae]|uniref:Uncharacterized protein n=1 Tax=Lecanicillium saksenae TaxID=468837 RepID=A0ACC1R5J8_9HYPO|nr:hypothetical protein NLG97_g803 [Lecanicillium saksenae]
MNERVLLDMALVSKRFRDIASDSQLWRPHYYRRFILPRAHRIPGFKTARSSSSLHYSLKGSAPSSSSSAGESTIPAWRKPASTTRWNAAHDKLVDRVDWKKQYRLRHNWARGRCAVEEVDVHQREKQPVIAPPEWQTLVKVVEGIAMTADSMSGLRAWDLRTRQAIAQAPLESDHATRLRPSCLAVDDARLSNGQIDVAVGFQDGTSGVWRLDAHRNTLHLLFRQEKSFLGRLVAIAYGYPYLLTATQLGFIALYTFNNPSTDNTSEAGDDADNEAAREVAHAPDDADDEHATLPPPYLLTSLKSHSTQGPLALSLRKNASSVVASIAYTFNTVGGWSIGIQDLDIRPSGAVTSRVASSLPTQIRSGHSSPSSSPLPASSSRFGTDTDDTGPSRLRYSHPYLLATLPDNTLVLHLCTSTSTSLTISPGMRLWGHTSGISDAEITPRGKAVSVSTRGDEIRLWELEGRVGGRSVEVRPRLQDIDGSTSAEDEPSGSVPRTPTKAGLDDGRRNWVGFDDEVVLVLKEASDGRDSLMLYDFT